jgi:hypothetical protein
MEASVLYDLEYVGNWLIQLDLQLRARTFNASLTTRRRCELTRWNSARGNDDHVARHARRHEV